MNLSKLNLTKLRRVILNHFKIIFSAGETEPVGITTHSFPISHPMSPCWIVVHWHLLLSTRSLLLQCDFLLVLQFVSYKNGHFNQTCLLYISGGKGKRQPTWINLVSKLYQMPVRNLFTHVLKPPKHQYSSKQGGIVPSMTLTPAAKLPNSCISSKTSLLLLMFRVHEKCAYPTKSPGNKSLNFSGFL